ncbi:MAG: DUF255 domain-containing protein [Halobacteriota archaeon]|nr:DUF255 domain-containing protein [Halobacteriota archaeon]
MEKPIIKWLNWEKESFDDATRLDKPILLKIGATWCHWCHVMDDTTYSDPGVIEVVNRDFIPISVDNDSRPDVNERYNMGGWPTTAFLTPDGIPMMGGTYIPPSDFLRVSTEVLRHYKENKGQIGVKPPQSIRAKIETDDLRWEIVEEIAGDVIDIFDSEHAGFGHSQKFPQPDFIDLLLIYSVRSRDSAFGAAATLTLDAMMEGEIWDLKRGGFYRYATKRDWSTPHYEKMLEDNSKLLSTYIDGYILTEDRRYLDTALQIRDFLLEDLFDGAFYGSVDADSKKVDRRIFTNWNGIAIKAFLKLFEVTSEKKDLDFAVEASEKILDTLYTRGKGVLHEVSEGEIKLLSDQVWFASALIDLYGMTGRKGYLEYEIDIVDFILSEFRWVENGLFLDSIAEYDLGVPGDKRWKIDDNSVLSQVLIDLSLITGEEIYLDDAEELLRRIWANYKALGVFSAPFAIALDKYLRLVRILVFGSSDEIPSLMGSISEIFEPNKMLEIVDSSLDSIRLSELGLSDKSGLYACKKGACLVLKGEDIKDGLKEFLGAPIGKAKTPSPKNEIVENKNSTGE